MSLSNKDNIQVSVCVVTYNQESYIAECLESLVTQQTSFKFEIIVGEDCSTDGTRAIVQQYVEQYPDLIVPLFYEENVGAVENVKRVYKAAKGKYIAHMDGDDMALPNKLQRQFDILEANPDCVICAHNMQLISFHGLKLRRNFSVYKKVKNTIFDLYQTLPFFAHSSKMFLNDMNEEFWSKLHPEALDIEVHAKQAMRGNIYYIPECYGIYRIGIGVSSEQKKVNPLIVAGCDRVFMEAISTYKDSKDLLETFYAQNYLNFSYQSAAFGDVDGYIRYIKKSTSIKIISLKQVFIWCFIWFPILFVFLSKLRTRIRYS
jgi:glycosyltransferase involved in cell wall biosynthesis